MSKMEFSANDVPFHIVDLRQAATYGLLPGFYWTVLLDAEGNPVEAVDSDRLIGPFTTTDEAFADAQDFLEECNNSYHAELKDAA